MRAPVIFHDFPNKKDISGNYISSEYDIPNSIITKMLHILRKRKILKILESLEPRKTCQ